MVAGAASDAGIVVIAAVALFEPSGGDVLAALFLVALVAGLAVATAAAISALVVVLIAARRESRGVG